MKIKLLFLLPLFISLQNKWHYSLEEARNIAQKEHKYILLNFSGSDWCGPCIRMRQEFFESAVFKEMADSELILVNADFPRNKKNQPSAMQQKMNDEMADKYNSKGRFPYTLLLDSDGNVLQTWDGFPEESVESFTIDIRNAMYTVRQK
ncbi:MAG TPA: thioredoxin family protein [Puia sp.]